MRTKKIAKFHVLLSQLKIRQEKKNILAGYGVESTKDLSNQELDECLDRFENILAEKQAFTDKRIRKQRSLVLGLLQRIGVYNNDGNWERVNSYLMNPRIAGKVLYELDEKELITLVRKLRKIEKKEDQKTDQNNWLAQNN